MPGEGDAGENGFQGVPFRAKKGVLRQRNPGQAYLIHCQCTILYSTFANTMEYIFFLVSETIDKQLACLLAIELPVTVQET